MNIWEILLTAAGLSLDVYAVCICKGAVIGRIDGKKLTQMCIVFSAWQVCALLAGICLLWFLKLRKMADISAASGTDWQPPFFWEWVFIC